MGGGSGRGRRGGGATDLHAAARSGDLVAVQTILSSNPLAVNSRDKHSRTPLHLAAWSGHTEVVSYLCKNKGDPSAAAMDDMGAVHFAAQKGHLEVLRSLFSSGASVKAATRKGFTPLHYASQGSHLDLVKYLVRKGADVTAKTKSGKTPLDLAGNDEVRKFLEECEEQSKKGNASTKKKAEEEKPEGSGGEVNEAIMVEGEGEKEAAKRKGVRDGSKEEEPSSSRAKKAKVALHHLQNDDDAEDGQEETL